MKRAFIINETGEEFEGKRTLRSDDIVRIVFYTEQRTKSGVLFDSAHLHPNSFVSLWSSFLLKRTSCLELTWSNRYHYKESLFILLIGKFVRAPLSYDTWRIVAKLVYFERLVNSEPIETT